MQQPPAQGNPYGAPPQGYAAGGYAPPPMQGHGAPAQGFGGGGGGGMGSPLASAPTPYAAPPPPPSLGVPQQGHGPQGHAPPPPQGHAPQGSQIVCPRCSTPTPVGFAFCQHCGLNMQGMQPTDPNQRPPLGSNPAIPPPTAAAGTGASGGPGGPGVGIDAQAATMASDGLRAGSIQAPYTPPIGGGVPSPLPPAPRSQTTPAWGTAVLVNRDGSDGQRYPLAGEYLVIGRGGSDIAFDEDRFLARQHARLERSAEGGVQIVPLDQLNGVFRKADAPVDLVDGTMVLVGREVLRFERVETEESRLHPLVRHGVALFGSPPREPWGRLLQMIPSGGYRDVRHLVGEEIVLGREDGDIVFRDDAFMSRRHAAVTWNGQRAQITDLGSSNGTFVRLTEATALKSGDHVRLGDQLLRIELGR